MASADDDMGIGSRVSAARRRRGWSREALAFHAGISWSAIRQLEAGRRRNLRPGTLSGLAGALGVTVDYLVSGRPVSSAMLEHRVLSYETDGEFRQAGVPFLKEAVERSEAALAVTTAAHSDLLREHLGAAERYVEFADQAGWCDTPAGALCRMRAFVDGHLEAGVKWIRILVEPMTAGLSEVEMRLWARYESVFNLVFRAAPLTALCAYDTTVLDADTITQASVTHPQILGEDGEWVRNAEYLDPVEFVLAPAADADADATPSAGANR